jgi:hypothetical protein
MPTSLPDGGRQHGVACSLRQCVNQESDKDAHGAQAEDEDRPCGAILGDLDTWMQGGVQMVAQLLKCRIEELRREDHAAVEQQQCPPDHRWFATGKYKHDQEGGKALQPEARFQADGGSYAFQRVFHALEQRLVLHGHDRGIFGWEDSNIASIWQGSCFFNRPGQRMTVILEKNKSPFQMT